MDTFSGEPQALVIAGFWRRVGAFFVDSILLGIAGQLIGLLAFDPLARMGAWARLIGFVIAFAYFGIGNSRFFLGQTLGKRLLDVRVVNARGETLSLPRSLSRYLVLGVPFFINGIMFGAGLATSLVLTTLLSLIVFGVGTSIVYLLVFNKRTRQSLHDLAVESYVVRLRPTSGVARFPSMWAGHWVVVALLVLFSLGAPELAQKLSHTDFFAGLTPLYQAVDEQPHVLSATVQRGSTSFNGNPVKHTVSARIRLDAPITNDSDYAEKIARILAKGDPHIANEDAVSVSLAYGFDIGIASSWTWRTYSFKPAEVQ